MDKVEGVNFSRFCVDVFYDNMDGPISFGSIKLHKIVFLLNLIFFLIPFLLFI